MKTSSTEVHSEFETGVRTIASNPFPGVDLIVLTPDQILKQKNVFRKSSPCQKQSVSKTLENIKSNLMQIYLECICVGV